MTYARKLASSNYNNRRFTAENCMLGLALENLSSRWTVQILFSIHFGLNRFSQIKKQLPNISDHILGLRLNHLVKNKLIIKNENGDEKTYELDIRGKTLIPILEQLTEWQTKC